MALPQTRRKFLANQAAFDMHNHAVLAQLLLIFVTLLWGSTFLTLQIALTWADPVVVVALRFLLASAILLCILRKSVLSITRYEWKAGFFSDKLL